MDRVEFDDVEVSLELRDAGERIVLVHASPFVAWHRPLVERLDECSTLVYCTVRPHHPRASQR